MFKREKKIGLSSREPTDSSDDDDDDDIGIQSRRKSKKRQARNRGQKQAGIMSEEDIITAVEEDSPLRDYRNLTPINTTSESLTPQINY